MKLKNTPLYFGIVYKRIKKSLIEFTTTLRRKIYVLLYCKQYKLIKRPEDIFKVLYRIKEETWEHSYTPTVFEIVKEREIIAKYPVQEIYQMENAIICAGSDIVLTEKGAWWDKYNDEDFMSCAIPADCNVYYYNREIVYAKKIKKPVFISGISLSLVGVWSYAWSHFLFQFLCKLYYAGKAGLLDQEITLITNDFKDPNINQVIAEYLIKYPKVKWMKTAERIPYKCENLICAPAMATNYDEFHYYLEYRLVIPHTVMDALSEYLVKPLIQKVKNNPQKYKKLFLERKNNRYLNNREEVEEFFRQEGFHFVECADLSLEEKADLFYHAEIIVGSSSSAFTNMIFCNGAKCMAFTNNRFANDGQMYCLSKKNLSRYFKVSGYDDSYNRRSNYTIPLDRIKAAYSALLNNEEI